MCNKPLAQQFIDFLREHNLRGLLCVSDSPSRFFSSSPEYSLCLCGYRDPEDEEERACFPCPCHKRLPLVLGFMREMLAQLDDEVSRLPKEHREVRDLIVKFQSELHYDGMPWLADP